MDGLASQIYNYMRGHAAALLVQHERSGISANRLQACYYTPRWYMYRLLAKLLGRNDLRDRFLKEEVTGYLAGLWFYYRGRNRR